MATTNTWDQVVSKITGVANRGAFSKTYTPTTSRQTQNGSAGYYSSITTVCNAVSLSGNASTSQVLSGRTFYTTSLTRQTGTMANRGNLNWSGSNTTYSVPAGYYSGGTLDSRTSYNNGYNAGNSAGQIAKRNNITLQKIGPSDNDVTINPYSFGTTSGRCYVAAMAGDPGQFQNFSISGATLLSNIYAGDTPPNGTEFVRMITFRATGGSVTITWNTGSTKPFCIVGLVN